MKFFLISEIFLSLQHQIEYQGNKDDEADGEIQTTTGELSNEFLFLSGIAVDRGMFMFFFLIHINGAKIQTLFECSKCYANFFAWLNFLYFSNLF